MGLRTGELDAKPLFLELEGTEFEFFELLQQAGVKEDNFYLKYVLFTIQKCHLNKDHEDCLLATLGLLNGYDKETIKDRQAKYCKNVGDYHKGRKRYEPYEVYWKDVQGSISDKAERLIKRVSITLQNEMEKNKNRLGYASNKETVLKIAQLSYPDPHYLHEDGYRKHTFEDKIFYVPLTKAEKLREANSATPGLESELEPEPASDLPPESEPEGGSEPEEKAETGAGSKPESEPTSDSPTESEPASDLPPESEPEGGSEPEEKAETGVGSKPESEPASNPSAEPGHTPPSSIFSTQKSIFILVIGILAVVCIILSVALAILMHTQNHPMNEDAEETDNPDMVELPPPEYPVRKEDEFSFDSVYKGIYIDENNDIWDITAAKRSNNSDSAS